MSEDYEDQLYENLNLRETHELLDIWEHGDPDEWQEEVYDLIGEILLERLGQLPPASPKWQARQRMEAAEEAWQAGNLDAAAGKLDQVLQVRPDLAEAHHLRGLIHAERKEYIQAVEAYQRALRLNPGLREVRQDLQDAELEYEDSFRNSAARQHLDRARELLRRGNEEEAEAECELARESLPELGPAHNELGEVLDEMGNPVKAILEYQKALQLDPDLEQAWYNLRDCEAELLEDFKRSEAKSLLDRAWANLQDEQADQALRECELARPLLPPIAPAYNLLGLILQGLDRLEAAEEAYLQAARCNPRFIAARENLANVRLKIEEEEHRQAARQEREEIPSSTLDEGPGLGEAWKENPAPGWVYRDLSALYLSGWPGYRTRPGRTGYDQLDSEFENAHIQGMILRRMFTLKMRTHNPLNLLAMTAVGLVLCLPLLGFMALSDGDPFTLITVLFLSLYWIPGIVLLVNVLASLRSMLTGEDDGTGHEFF